MQMIVSPGNPLQGEVTLPGDKSLSHRAVLFAALALGQSRIKNFLVSGVTRVMLDSLKAVGIHWSLNGDELVVEGRGLSGWRCPEQTLNCGNSATTMRLLAGAVAATGISAILDGSSGLRKRPMDRIVEPLRQMNVEVNSSEGALAPLTFSPREAGRGLMPIHISMPVASAQVKSCLLLAALAATGESVLREPGPSRDHTERMLRSMGISIASQEIKAGETILYETRLQPPTRPLSPFAITLPGDISSAAFLVVAALITPGSEITIRGIGLNPTRTGLIEVLKKMGGDIQVINETNQAGEPAGDLVVRYSKLMGTEVKGPLVVRMIDEFSVFGAAASFAEGITVVREASELRYKESDRISTLQEELKKLDVAISEVEDGFTVIGGQLPTGGVVGAHGDHRLAMSLAVMGLAAKHPVIVQEAEMIEESFPDFHGCLSRLGADIKINHQEAR